jgi:hypothetical protein
MRLSSRRTCSSNKEVYLNNLIIYRLKSISLYVNFALFLIFLHHIKKGMFLKSNIKWIKRVPVNQPPNLIILT